MSDLSLATFTMWVRSSSIRRAADLAQGEAHPITDVRASAEYRSRLVNVFVERTLRLAADRARKEMAAR